MKFANFMEANNKVIYIFQVQNIWGVFPPGIWFVFLNELCPAKLNYKTKRNNFFKKGRHVMFNLAVFLTSK